MAGQIEGEALGMFELDNLVACFVALDAAAKTADITVQGVERNRLKSGACVKFRGSVSEVRAAMEAALRAAEPIATVTGHNIIPAPAADTEIAIRATIYK